MAFGILQTFYNRLAEYKGVEIKPESTILRQITQDRDRQHQINEIEIEEIERMPMVEVPAYRDRRNGGKREGGTKAKT
jgi:hypothetical protein